jgi:endonuclease III related protein
MSVNRREHIRNIYKKLYALYGPQGWWPLTDYEGKNPTKTGSLRGYHPLNYDLPENEGQIFEIIVGAILTQNTAWTSAQMAIYNLKELNAVDPHDVLEISNETLKEAIRCAGFLNQKAVYLREISRFFISLQGRIPPRTELLQVKGVGNETADSILLYAYKKPEFVVDAYTRRIFTHLGLLDENINYMELKKLFESNLPLEVPVYQEYHALIVEHAKRYYRKKPYGTDDPLKKVIGLNNVE